MPNAARLRVVLRWAHIVEAALIGVYVYSPLHAHPVWTGVMRFGVFPLAAVSGVWMWQQARIARALHGPHRAAFPA
jgi:hypothetical protein